MGIETFHRLNVSSKFLPPDSPIILVFGHRGSLLNSDGFTPKENAEYKGEFRENWAIFYQ